MSDRAPRIAVLAIRTLRHSVGGQQVHLRYLLRELEELGCSGSVITSGGTLDEADGSGGAFTFVHLEGVRDRYGSAWWRGSRRVFHELHREDPFDLVISHGLAGWSVARLPESRRPPVLYWTQGFQPTHLLNRAHDVIGVGDLIRYPLVAAREAAWLSYVERDVARRAAGVVCAARYIRGLFRRIYRIGETRLHVVHNWIDTRLLRPDPQTRDEVRRQLGWDGDILIAMMAAVMSPQKGLRMGLQALRSCMDDLPQIRVLLVGNGPERPLLERDVRAWGMRERVVLAGAVDQPRMAKLLKSADLFLMPSRRFEGLPFVVLEAMACGLAVAGSDRAGIAEAIADSGALLPVGDRRAWVSWIRSVAVDERLRASLGAAARRRAERAFGRERARRQLEELLRSVT